MSDIEYKIEHPGITVADLEKAIKFYTENFGFKEMSRKDKPDLELKLASLQLEDSYLELIQLYQPKIRIDLRKNPSIKELLQTSTSHIALSVNNLDIAYQSLNENNVQLRDFNEKFFFCFDPDGFLIEIRQK